jgi:hypothetical protein
MQNPYRSHLGDQVEGDDPELAPGEYQEYSFNQEAEITRHGAGCLEDKKC